jgi:GT2 family glycosyltransferase
MKEPLFSILLPVYNPRIGWFREALDSVLTQTFPHWELCIADDASPDPLIRELIAEYSRADSRVKYVFRKSNGHISAASNSALDLVSGKWIVLMDHDDLLPSSALERVAVWIEKHPEARLFYSDEDKIGPGGRRHAPYYKCDWNRDLFYSHNLISHLGVYHAGTVREIGGFREGVEGSQDYDLALRCLEATGDGAVCHIPEVLYHWREHPESTASGHGAKSYAMDAGIRALNEHYARTGVPAVARDGGMGSIRSDYSFPAGASLEVLVSSRGQFDSLTARLKEIEEEFAGLAWEMTVVARDSGISKTLGKRFSGDPRLKFVHVAKGETSAHCLNRAARISAAGYLLFLTDSLRPLGKGWCRELIAHAARAGIGAVGSKLLYTDGRVRQAGLLLDERGIFRRAFHHYQGDSPGYMGRLRLVQNFSAVGMEGMMISRDKFLAAGGFDEQGLKSRYHDVDLCLRLRRMGLRNLWTPHACFFERHLFPRLREWAGSISPLAKADRRLMRSRWGEQLDVDPCYGQNLSQVRKDFGCPPGNPEVS